MNNQTTTNFNESNKQGLDFGSAIDDKQNMVNDTDLSVIGSLEIKKASGNVVERRIQ